MTMTRRTFMIGTGIAGVSGLSASSSRAAAGVEMPPESGPHTRTFMQWPVSVEVYGERDLARVQKAIATVANAISEHEEVVLLCAADAQATVKEHVSASVTLWDIPTDDLWCRDSGPTFVRDGAGNLAVSLIQFNGWGGKQTAVNDAKIAARVAERLGLPLLDNGLVGEQGGLEHDGAGLVLAHASSWINPNRNPGTEAEVGEKILAAVGGRKMIWAPGIMGADITDYHIDALARFVAPGRVLIQMPEKLNPDDPWSVSAFETLAILKEATTPEGKPLDIVVVPEPVNIRSRKTDFVAAYVNYYVCNGAVIASEFGDKMADETARALLQDLYPGRTVVMLNTDAIGESGGGIHCSTQQQPEL
jgi:agmatine deiminase